MENDIKETGSIELPGNENDDSGGEVKIGDDVILVIANNAATKVEGVYSMSGSIAGEIAQALGRKSLSKGVKLERDINKLFLDLYIVVEYGVRIPDISWKVQESVKKELEEMTGLSVMEVNIHIQGVYINDTEGNNSQ